MPSKLRAQQIVIDIPTEDGSTWINAILQTLIKDEEGQTVQRMDRTHMTHRVLEDSLLELKTIKDPVTDQEITLSAAGAAAIVRAFVLGWMKEDHGGTTHHDSLGNPSNLTL